MNLEPFCKTCKSEIARAKYRRVCRDLDAGDMVSALISFTYRDAHNIPVTMFTNQYIADLF